jgi:hypothetical protein
MIKNKRRLTAAQTLLLARVALRNSVLGWFIIEERT